MTHRIRVLGFVSLFATFIPALSVASPPFFFDTTFADENWTVTVESINGGGTGTGSGNGAAKWRTTMNELNAAAPGEVNTVYAFHRFAGATYQPSSGPILSIEYLEETIRLSGARQLCGLAIRQDGIVYYGLGFLSPSELNKWIPAVQSNLLQTNFDAIAPGLQRPDFSAAGGVIEFGFYRASSTTVGGPAITTRGGIDGWHLVLNVTEAPVATAHSTWGRVKSLYRSH